MVLEEVLVDGSIVDRMCSPHTLNSETTSGDKAFRKDEPHIAFFIESFGLKDNHNGHYLMLLAYKAYILGRESK